MKRTTAAVLLWCLWAQGIIVAAGPAATVAARSTRRAASRIRVPVSPAVKVFIRSRMPALAPYFWASFTASVTGNWGDSATWGGAGVPASGDTIAMNDGVSLTIPSGYHATVGTSPVSAGTAAIACTSGSSGTAVLIVNGWLTYQGPVLQCANWSAGPGAILEHDSHLAASPSTTNYHWSIGLSGLVGGRTLTLAGSPQSRITVQIATGSGNSGGFDFTSTSGGVLGASFTDIADCGTSTISCNVVAQTTLSWTMDDSTVTRSGKIFIGGSITSGSAFRMLRTRITAPINSSVFNVDWQPGGSNVGQRLVQDCDFEGQFRVFYAGQSALHIINNIFESISSFTGPFTRSGATEVAEWESNLLIGRWVAAYPFGTVGATYHVFLLGDNHYTSLATATVATTIQHVILESTVCDNGSGDWIQVEAQSASAAAITVKNNIMLPQPCGGSPGSFVNITFTSATSAAPLAITVEHNTWVSSQTNALNLTNGVGSENNVLGAGVFASVKSNIAYNTTNAGNGYVVGQYPLNTPDDGSFVGVDYNMKYQLAGTAPYVGYIPTTDAKFSTPSPPGTHDVVGDPQLYDSTRRMATFDQAYMGFPAGTEWNTYGSGNTFAVGQVVGHVISGYYGSALINYRCKTAHVKSTSNSEPGAGTNWFTYWELNSVNVIRERLHLRPNNTQLAPWRPAECLVGSTNGIICEAISWVAQGQQPTNVAAQGAAHDGTDIGAVQHAATPAAPKVILTPISR